MVEGKYILDENGSPVAEPDLLKWVEWCKASIRWRIVAKTMVGEREVSTVFLALDHNFGGEGLPLLFETMVFNGDSRTDEICERYATRDEAMAAHKIIVESLRCELALDGELK